MPTLPPILEPATPPLPSLLPSIPPAHLTLLLGDPGIGKSLLAIDLASRLSNNAAPPPHPPTPRDLPHDQIPDDADPHNYQPATAIILSTEDTHDTLRFRLITAGAHFPHISLPYSDLSLVPPHPRDFRIAFSRSNPQPATLIEWLLLNIKKLHNPRLLILDSLPSFLGSCDCSNAATIRTLLHPLLIIAEVHNFAVLGLSHLTKSSRISQPALHRSLGSLAYPALARSVLLLSPDLHHPNRRTLTQIKNNLGPLQPPLSFTIATTCSTPKPNPPAHPTQTNNPPTISSPYLLWHPSSFPADPSPLTSDPCTQSQLDLAQKFLLQSLTPGPLPSALLLKQARSLGLSQRTLARARFLLQTHCYLDAPSNQWLIALPNPPTTLPPDPTNPPL